MLSNALYMILLWTLFGEIKADWSHRDRVDQKPYYINVRSGDSVTLSCSFSINCPQENISVIWLRSRFSPKIIYESNGNQNHSCEKRDSGETSCVHHLTMEHLDFIGKRIYLCVVNACGHTEVGDGTEVHVYGSFLWREVLYPTEITLILSNLGLALVVFALLQWIYRKHTKQTEEDVSSHGPPYNNQAEDASAAGRAMGSSASCRSTAVKHRQTRAIY